MRMKVIIVGAGIGGLTLAQGLHRAGIEIAVYDRDPRVDATGGYRIQVDEHACAVLKNHLTPQHYQALLASSAPRGSTHGFSWTDHRLRPIGTYLTDGSTAWLSIGRVPLRTLLAHGLDERLHFDSEYANHAILPDGRVEVCFADGGSDTADVLVGADGARSRVATALAGRALSAPTGFGGIAARTPLTPQTRDLLPDIVAGLAVFALGPSGAGVFMTLHDPATGPTVDPASCTDIRAVTEAPALIWGLNASESILDPDQVGAMSGDERVEHAVSALRGWPRELRDLVAATDPASAGWFRFYAADPDADLTPWSANQVTALGDAVHAMPPTGGRAAATAIRDAGHLAHELIAARDGQTTVALATHNFHRHMAAYAPDAVRFSLRPLRWIRQLDRPGLPGVARVGLTAASAAHQLRRTLTSPGTARVAG
jgi:salicylate hydroxylase